MAQSLDLGQFGPRPIGTRDRGPRSGDPGPGQFVPRPIGTRDLGPRSGDPGPRPKDPDPGALARDMDPYGFVSIYVDCMNLCGFVSIYRDLDGFIYMYIYIYIIICFINLYSSLLKYVEFILNCIDLYIFTFNLY